MKWSEIGIKNQKNAKERWNEKNKMETTNPNVHTFK